MQQLQYFLNIVADAYPSIPAVQVDSRFGSGLERSIKAFQQEFGIPSDGLVGAVTWNLIYETYAALIQNA